MAGVGIQDPQGTYHSPSLFGTLWDSVGFQTQSIPRLALRVGVIGDSGFGELLTYELTEQMAHENLDFVLHTGDIVYKVAQNANPVEAFILKFYDPFESLLKELPLYPVVGNHEWDSATYWLGMPYYYWAFPGFEDSRIKSAGHEERNEWYAFSYDDIQFVMLNTQVLLSGTRWSEQNEWLEERLADTRFRTTIVVFHVPPYTSGLHTLDGFDVRKFWQPLFEEANVPLVLSGHDHNYERLSIEGIAYVVSGGGSSVLYTFRSQQAGSQVFATVSHYVVLEILQNQIELRAVALGGEVFDRATIAIP
jgi:predicted phosphodiesterase